jgi:hypothetical protein
VTRFVASVGAGGATIQGFVNGSSAGVIVVAQSDMATIDVATLGMIDRLVVKFNGHGGVCELEFGTLSPTEHETWGGIKARYEQ